MKQTNGTGSSRFDLKKLLTERWSIDDHFVDHLDQLLAIPLDSSDWVLANESNLLRHDICVLTLMAALKGDQHATNATCAKLTELLRGRDKRGILVTESVGDALVNEIIFRLTVSNFGANVGELAPQLVVLLAHQLGLHTKSHNSRESRPHLLKRAVTAGVDLYREAEARGDTSPYPSLRAVADRLSIAHSRLPALFNNADLTVASFAGKDVESDKLEMRDHIDFELYKASVLREAGQD